MSWHFYRVAGEFGHTDTPLETCTVAYSGHPPAVNDPSYEKIADVGPIPAGDYTIGRAFDSEHLGPCVMPLIPWPSTNTFNRDDFFIHGDNARGNHSASKGCIVLPPYWREKISHSQDRHLMVI